MTVIYAYIEAEDKKKRFIYIDAKTKSFINLTQKLMTFSKFLKTIT